MLEKIAFAMLAIAIVAADVSSAEAPPKGCFTRVYSKAHLAAHPGQKVTAIGVQVGFPLHAGNAPYDDNLLWVKFRGSKKRFEQYLYCKELPAGLDCGLEGDGGRALISTASHGITITNRHGFYFDGEEEFIVPDDGEHRTFLLAKTASGPCKP